jgi:hypothetical protein
MTGIRRFTIAIALSMLTIATLGAQSSFAAQTEQCLTPDEVTLSARMASVMSLGAALQRCGTCLGERYAEVVQRYEGEGLLKDFWAAQKKIKGQEKVEYVDDLVRQAARNKTADLSASCESCNAMADTLNHLASDDARSKFYESEQGELGKVRIFKSCP